MQVAKDKKMELDDFLKCKKVRCLSNDYDFNEQGKAYKLHGLRVFITDETGCTAFLPIEDFEPVLDSAENPLQDVELTSEFEAVEPKFKVGDRVYYFGEQYIYTYLGMDIAADGTVLSLCAIDKHGEKSYTHPVNLCHATSENHALLSQLYPHIKFEAPPKELTGSDLARAMLDKGWQYIPCYVSNYGESEAQKPCIVRKFSSSGQFVSEFEFYNNAVPFDPRTGELLTESILND